MLITSINLGAVVYELLKGILPTFPIISEVGTAYPFSCYRRTSVNVDMTKDRRKYFAGETANYEIVIAASTYDESVKLAEDCVLILQEFRGEIKGVKISQITVTNASENFISDAYTQTLSIAIEIE